MIHCLKNYQLYAGGNIHISLLAISMTVMGAKSNDSFKLLRGEFICQDKEKLEGEPLTDL